MTVVSISSASARTATEAAADTAISNVSWSAWSQMRSASRTTDTWALLVSRYWRTRNVPDWVAESCLAEERQWMCRWSSPGTYSRNAWNARSLGDRSAVG